MKTILHISSEAEPKELYAIEPSDWDISEIFGVHVAVEVQADGADLEEAAKELVDDFLKQVPEGEFHLIRIDTNAAPNVAATWVEPGTPPTNLELDRVFQADTANTLLDFERWLERAKGAFEQYVDDVHTDTPAKDLPFYRSPGPARPQASMRNAKAVDLLRAAARWPAPLAQNAGLTTALKLSDFREKYEAGHSDEGQPKHNLEYCFVFCEKGAALPETWEVTSGGISDDTKYVELEGKAAGGVVVRRYQTSLLKPFKQVDSRFEPNGVFKVPSGEANDNSFRLLSRIEALSPSLLSAATIVDDLALNEEAIQRIAPFPEQGADNNHQRTKNLLALLAWLKQAAIVSLFDTALIALGLEDPLQDPAGVQPDSVLGELANLIAEAFEAEEYQLDVDELMVYRNLHQKLLTVRSGLVGTKFWELIEPLEPDAGRFADIKRVLLKPEKEGDNNAWSWEKWKADFTGFLAPLGELRTLLESEDGLEAWLLGLFDEAFLDEDGLSFSIHAVNGDAGNLLLGGQLESQYNINLLSEAYRAFKTVVRGEFNAAEMVRRDFGARVIERLTSTSDSDADKDIRQRVLDAVWFSRRFGILVDDGGGQDNGLFKGLESACVPVKPPLQDEVLVKQLAKQLDLIYEGHAKELCETHEKSRAFQPDQFPQPLPIKISNSLDPAEFDKVSSQTSGLGFVVCASGPNSDSLGVARERSVTQHASLVGLLVDNGERTATATATVLPTLPVRSLGSAGLYLSYSGLPLASPNLPVPSVGGAELDAQQYAAHLAEKALRPFKAMEAEYGANSGLPPLAYGFRYSLFGFWVPPSGVLPGAVRQDGTWFTPELSADKIRLDGADKDSGYLYLRRTAVAEMGLSAMPAIPQRVFPLALDDPRLVLSSVVGGAERHIDLYRRADGSGALDGQDKLVTLHDLRLDDELVNNLGQVLVVHKHTAAVFGEPVEEDKITFDPHASTLNVELDGDSDEPFWLRFKLKRFEGQVQDHHLSFSDPAHGRGQASADKSLPLLLLEPDGPKDHWVPSVTRAHTLEVQFPSVSFMDFECWGRNKLLWKDATGGRDTFTVDGKYTLFHGLCKAHHVFKSIDDAEYLEKLDRLPDPAVRGFYVSAAISDALDETAKEKPKILENGASANNGPAALFVAKSPYESLAKSNVADAGSIEDLRALVDELHRLSILVLEVTSDSKDSVNQNLTPDYRLLVPEGAVTRVQFNPAIPATYFEADIQPGEKYPKQAIAEGLRQLGAGWTEVADIVTGKAVRYELFDGARFEVEVMHALSDDNQVALESVSAVTEGRERGYTVAFKPEQVHRIFAEAQLQTQQWQRFGSGRPIYHWIDPVQSAEAASTLPGPVVRVQTSDAAHSKKHAASFERETLDAFEGDAFFGIRSDVGLRTAFKRLQPYPSHTVLDEVAWPERSATYLRHAVVLRSRYAGAVKDTSAAERGVGDKDKWALRAAILAEPFAAPITRPQLRALVPLQRTLAGQRATESGDTTPPIAAILNEPPFSQLGLADRVEADLRTTNTYVIEGEEEDARLRVDALRKEWGADPLLSYFSVPDDESRQTSLIAEGPVGLHFDVETAESPYFSNSQLMLHVNTGNQNSAAVSRPGELEEGFLGISLFRYADPAWSFVPDENATAQHAGSGASQIEDDGAKGDCGPIMVPHNQASWFKAVECSFKQPVNKSVEPVEQDARDNKDQQDEFAEIIKVAAIDTKSESKPGIKIEIAKEALFEQGGAGSALFLQVPAEDQDSAEVYLLLNPLGDRRYQLSVFLQSLKGSTLPAMGVNRPRLLASVAFRAWGDGPLQIHAAGKCVCQHRNGHKLPDGLKLRPTRQSEMTFMEWARTSRDMSKLWGEPLAPSSAKPDALETDGDHSVDVQSLRAAIVNSEDRPCLLALQRSSASQTNVAMRVLSPVSNRRYPLHVHRHLALIIRKPSEQIGHQVDLFDQAVLWDGQNSQLEAPPPDGATVTVGEFESRAEIVLVSDGGKCSDAVRLQQFKSGYFDLKSTCNSPSENIGQIRLRFRAATAEVLPSDLIVEISNTLEPVEDKKTLKVPLPPASPNESPWAPTRFFELILSKPQNEGWTSPNVTLQVPGYPALEVQKTEGEFKQGDGFYLTIHANGKKDAERWMDVSMLHSAASPKSADDASFDFDWLFGAKAPAQDLPNELSARTLNQLPEAQMRLIGWSDAIPVVTSRRK